MQMGENMQEFRFISLVCLLFLLIISAPVFAEVSSSLDVSQNAGDLIFSDFPGNTVHLAPIPVRRPDKINTVNQSEPVFLSQIRRPVGEVLKETEEEPEDFEDDIIADPLEPMNRAFFFINDKLYFYVMKPVSQGYSAVFPEGTRIAFRNFFNNISTPVRFVNNLLQFKVKSAGNELLRLLVNTTGGVLGLMDYAKDEMKLPMQDEDFGQTLGAWGLGPLFYLNLPILGPTSMRDGVGRAGDYFLDPISYIDPSADRIAIKAGDRVNRTSLVIGEYEKFKKESFDPYIAVRDAYYQHRKREIEE
jgi:phospholipid-binding lipoprotein MlaA